MRPTSIGNVERGEHLMTAGSGRASFLLFAMVARFVGHGQEKRSLPRWPKTTDLAKARGHLGRTERRASHAETLSPARRSPAST
jgi:hypothetical protein